MLRLSVNAVDAADAVDTVDVVDAVDAVSVERKLRLVDADGLFRGIWALDWSSRPSKMSGNSCEQLCLRGLVVVL